VKAFVITLRGHQYSERVAARCIKTARDIGGIDVEYFDAVTADETSGVIARRELEWTWGKGGAGLKHHSYGGNDAARIACAMSHYALWERCAWGGKPILVLEHDAVFIRQFESFDFESACQINDPEGATPRGRWWHDQMVKRGDGVWPKTTVLEDPRPDGLAGNSAYVIKPAAALRLMKIVRKIGVWPNDATMCRQLVPGLQEHYPFITRVEPEQSTINA
jgi:GR25 family glycosyltransferase involved in LPS biosynthesis